MLGIVFDESLYGSVIGLLYLRWEAACRELSAAQMVSYAFTAYTLLIAWLPSAWTMLQILPPLTYPLAHAHALLTP